MSDIVEVSEAIVERLVTVLPDWTTLWYEPTGLIPVPGLCVEADPAKSADYQMVPPRWFLRIGLYVAANDQEAALRTMAPLTGTKGPIIKALKDTVVDYDDTLSQLSMGNVWPTTLTGWKVLRRNRSRYLRAYIGVQVGAN